jgi:SAM-dependent methyltransferase
VNVPGVAGYDQIARSFIERTEDIPFETGCAPILPYLPAAPARVLDIGAAHGRISAELAVRGHAVTAVEPADVLRSVGIQRRAHLPIAWLDDALPELAGLGGKEGGFDLVLALFMWMHLDPLERRRAMQRIVELLGPGGIFAVTLRHGPFPDNRLRFELSAEETTAHAEAEGLSCLLSHVAPATQEGNRRLGVSWTWFVFRKP